MTKNIYKLGLFICLLLLTPLSIVAQEDVVIDREKVEEEQKESKFTLQKILNKLDIPQKHKRLFRAFFRIFTEEEQITAHATLQNWEKTSPLDLILEKAKDAQ